MFPEVSGVMLERKVDSVEDAQVELVATDCPACILQIRGGLDKRGKKVRVAHTAQIVAERDAISAPITGHDQTRES